MRNMITHVPFDKDCGLLTWTFSYYYWWRSLELDGNIHLKLIIYPKSWLISAIHVSPFWVALLYPRHAIDVRNPIELSLPRDPKNQASIENLIALTKSRNASYLSWKCPLVPRCYWCKTCSQLLHWHWNPIHIQIIYGFLPKTVYYPSEILQRSGFVAGTALWFINSSPKPKTCSVNFPQFDSNDEAWTYFPNRRRLKCTTSCCTVGSDRSVEGSWRRDFYCYLVFGIIHHLLHEVAKCLNWWIRVWAWRKFRSKPTESIKVLQRTSHRRWMKNDQFWINVRLAVVKRVSPP